MRLGEKAKNVGELPPKYDYFFNAGLIYTCLADGGAPREMEVMATSSKASQLFANAEWTTVRTSIESHNSLNFNWDNYISNSSEK
jgi:hypothetical protein